MAKLKDQSIFFAAASPKRVPDAQLKIYKRIVLELKKQGFEISYDWLSKKDVLSSQQAYNLVMNSLHKSDFLLADVSVPSIGVGQQIAMAIQWRIPVVCIYNRKIQETPSKMLPSDQTNLFRIIPYTPDKLADLLKDIFPNEKDSKMEKFNFVLNSDMNNFIKVESEKREMSKSQFLRFIVKSWKDNNL